jgi:hypothetical protein
MHVVKQMSNLPWRDNMKGQDAMEQAYDADPSFSFLIRYFGAQLGYEILEIDGIASQIGQIHFFFGNLASTGILPTKELMASCSRMAISSAGVLSDTIPEGMTRADTPQSSKQ